MGLCVVDVAYELGSKVHSVSELAKKFKLTSDKYEDLRNKIGTNFIYENSESEDFASLAIKSIKVLLDNNEIDQDNLGLIFVTQSNSKILPADGQRIRSICGLPDSVFVLDVNMGCSGFIYGLAVANSFIQSSSFKQIILVAGDTYRNNINTEDRSTFLLFSDAVSATLIESKESSQILGFDFGGDGINFEDISLSKQNFRDTSSHDFYMNGGKVFQFTQNSIPNSINRVLTKNSTKIDDLKLVIFHQASRIVLDTLIEKFALNISQTSETISKFGNTGSASIPITLSEYLKFSALEPGDLVLLSGFGIGLSFGSVLLKW